MKRTFFQITALLSLIVIGYSACQKEKDSNDSSVAESIISVEDNALADETFTDIFTDLAGLGLDDNGPFSSMTNSGSNKISTVPTDDHEHQMGCADLSVTPLGDQWPKSVTADFGTGCSHNGITKKGKIIAVFNKNFRTDGAEIQISFDGFYVTNHKIEGTSTITNKGENDAGNQLFTVKITNGKIIGIKTISWSSIKTIEWDKNTNKSSLLDDRLWITGTASGTNTVGKEFTVNVTEKLVRPVLCPFFSEGTLEVKQGDNTLTLNYGTGTCDNKATITVNGVTKEIELKK